jgi:CAAX protease family protein
MAAFLVRIVFSLIATQFGPLLTDEPPITSTLAVSLLFVWAVIVAPLTEELIFRGFLYRGLAASRLGVPGAIVVTSVLWAAAHTDRTWLGHIAVLPAGIALGWLRWQSDATMPGISVHALYNMVAIAFVLGWGAPR